MSEHEVFPNVSEEDRLHEGDHFFIMREREPVSEGHLLIVAKEPRKDFFELTEQEQRKLPEMIHEARILIENAHVPDGYNIGMDCGIAAGQEVPRFHCHVIPRYDEENESPPRGIRSLLA